MAYIETTATSRIISMKKRIRLIAGGTSASKTISVLLYLIDKAQSDKQPTLTSVVSESFPHLKRGAIRDFKNIMQDHLYWKEERWNATDNVYTLETGSKIEFFSADQPSKIRGPRRDRLFVNEANNILKESWVQLLLRTKEFAIADWNPVADFFMYEDYGLTDVGMVGASDPDTEFIILTYEDNEALSPSIVNEIEKRRDHRAWFEVYGRGRRGEIEGRIYKGWQWIDEVPHEARFVKRGLDFGYTNDPTGILDVYEYNGGFIFDEQCYQYGMSNEDINTFVRSLPDWNRLIIADSSEPKSIARLQALGLNIIGAVKGPDSIKQGIDFIQSQRISATKRSLNLKKEYERYIWLKDRLTDRFINEAPDVDNHLLDPARYALESYMPRKEDKRAQTSNNISGYWS